MTVAGAYEFTVPSPAGLYHFVITALTATGQESEYSNAVSKSIQ